jgi:hypothetical protein
MMKLISKKVNSVIIAAKAAVMNRKAEGYVDSGVKILIAVVVGGLLLTLLYALFNDIIMPTVNDKVQNLFSFNG